MSHQQQGTAAGHGVAYDPVPNFQDESDTPLDDSPYDPYSQHMSAPPLDDELNPNEPSINLVRPRFLGTLHDEGIRQSLASVGSQPQSETVHSVYALNPGSLSARASQTLQPDPAAGRFSTPYRDDPRSPSEDVFDGPSVPMENFSQARFLKEKQALYASPASKSRRRNVIVLAALGGVILLIVIIVVPVYFLAIKPHSNKSSSSQSSHSTAASPSSTSSPSSPKSAAITGGDGSTVTMNDGTKFIYHNSFGGFWYHDPKDPLNNGAKPQSWTPALNETFNYGTDPIRGVNLGGWLVIEPFITPALFQKYPTAIDEWTLSVAMASDTAGGGLNQLEDHYKTFITEQDFAQIAGAGLNHVRIPLGYWAIETWDGEPFLAKTAWKYFLKAIEWARKYGIRINLDFHAVPGSQNGWNHSGKFGTINLINGPMGYANAQRTLDYIRVLAEFVSQPQYKDVVTMFGPVNEPQSPIFGQDNLSRFYFQAYNDIREASGTGTGNGPLISIHDGFAGIANWAGYLPGGDRVGLDYHPYLCFGTQIATPMSSNVNQPCTTWAAALNDSMAAFGLTSAGEFSNAINDCGTFLNGVGLGARYDGSYTTGGPWPVVGSCSSWVEYQSWSQDLKTSILQFALASMDALQNWFFWTWKIGNSSTSGLVESPAWSYQLGLENGWMPTDPRQAVGVCGATHTWQPPLAPTQTGGSGAGQIAVSVSSKYSWPPVSISNAGAVTTLPRYTQTGSILTLPNPTFTSTSGSIKLGDGWANPSDTVKMAVPISTCSYLSPWCGTVAVPAVCGTQSASKREVVFDVNQPTITPAPTPSW